MHVRKPNPMARDLMQPKYRQRTVEGKIEKTARRVGRKAKHKAKEDLDE